MQSAIEPRSRSRAKPAACARVTVFCVGVVVVLSTFAFRVVRADVRERLFEAGEAMMAYPGAPHEGVRQLRLNGIEISFRVRTVSERLQEVLEHYESLCKSGAIALDAQRNRETGYVACLAADQRPPDAGTVVERLVEFARTRQLLTLGGFRYAFAREFGRDSKRGVLLLTAWSDSAFDLADLLPTANGDAAGHDPPGLPRPPGTQRVLSASELGRPSGVFVYRVQHPNLDHLRRSYRGRLVADGWSIIERSPGESIQIDDIRMFAAEKNGTLATVLLRSSDYETPVLTILTSEPS